MLAGSTMTVFSECFGSYPQLSCIEQAQHTRYAMVFLQMLQVLQEITVVLHTVPGDSFTRAIAKPRQILPQLAEPSDGCSLL